MPDVNAGVSDICLKCLAAAEIHGETLFNIIYIMRTRQYGQAGEWIRIQVWQTVRIARACSHACADDPAQMRSAANFR